MVWRDCSREGADRQTERKTDRQAGRQVDYEICSCCRHYIASPPYRSTPASGSLKACCHLPQRTGACHTCMLSHPCRPLLPTAHVSLARGMLTQAGYHLRCEVMVSNSQEQPSMWRARPSSSKQMGTSAAATRQLHTSRQRQWPSPSSAPTEFRPAEDQLLMHQLKHISGRGPF